MSVIEPPPEILTAEIPLPLPAEKVGALGSAAWLNVGGYEADALQVVQGKDWRLGVRKYLEGASFTSYGHSYGVSTAETAPTTSPNAGATSKMGTFPYLVARRLGMELRTTGLGQGVRHIGGYSAAGVQELVMGGGDQNIAAWQWTPMWTGPSGRDRGIVVIDCITNELLYRHQSTANLNALRDTLRAMCRWVGRQARVGYTQATNMGNANPNWANLNDSGPSSYWFHYIGGRAEQTNGSVPLIAPPWPAVSSGGETYGGHKAVICYLKRNQFHGGGTIGVFDLAAPGGPVLRKIIDTSGGYDDVEDIPTTQFMGTQLTWPYDDTSDPDYSWPFFLATEIIDFEALGFVNASPTPETGEVFYSYQFQNTTPGLFIGINTVWAPARFGPGDGKLDSPPFVYLVKDGFNPAWINDVSGIPAKQAKWDAFNSTIDDVCAEPEFSDWVFPVDMDAFGWDYTKHLHVGAHPNDEGCDLYARALEEKIYETVGDYIEGVNMMGELTG